MSDIVSNEPVIEFRQAVEEDAKFIAKYVIAAMGWDLFDPDYDPMSSPLIFEQDDYTEGSILTTKEAISPSERTAKFLEKMTKICLDEHTLYSYKNTIVATIDGEVVGSLTGYDGGAYAEMKKKTSEFAKSIRGVDMTPEEEETSAGEFYLDSMAVSPKARGHSLGRKLINKMVDMASKRGFKRITLIAEKARPWLLEMYEGLGFVQENEMPAFGHTYIKMAKQQHS